MAVTVCQGIDDLKKLIVLDSCFSIKMKEKILAELCCLKEMSLPVDGFKRISDSVAGGATFDLFDNMLDTSTSPPSTAYQVRGVIFCLSYPKTDDAGTTIADTNKTATLRIYDKQLNTIDIPVYNFFAMTNNTVLTDTDKIINKMQVVNDSADPKFNIGIEGLLLLVNPTGVKITRVII